MAALENQEAVVAARAAVSLGYTTIKPMQKLVIASVLRGKDVFAILPTGYGKSLCYQALPIAFDQLHQLANGTTIVLVIGPLKALLKDQVSSCAKRGLTCGYICEDTTDEMKKSIIRGECQLVYATPESLMNKRWRQMLCTSSSYAERVRAVIFDEAHCIDKWGGTFRDAFLHVGEVRSLLPPNIPILLLTATITKSSRLHVEEIIGIKSPLTFKISPNKKNISYSVEKIGSLSISEVFDSILSELKLKRLEMPRTIIFCRTINDCSAIYFYFKDCLGQDILELRDDPDLSQFRLVDMFHRYVDSDVKESIISSFCTTQSPLRILICTMAFGIGIDCCSVSRVFHFGPPDDLASYIQETGRCGRDPNSLCSATLYIRSRLPKTVQRDMRQYIDNTVTCRRKILFWEMEGYYDEACSTNCCDLCDSS